MRSGRRNEIGDFAVSCREGDICLFEHDLYHEGERIREGSVDENGEPLTKWILRTDVLFEKISHMENDKTPISNEKSSSAAVVYTKDGIVLGEIVSKKNQKQYQKGTDGPSINYFNNSMIYNEKKKDEDDEIVVNTIEQLIQKMYGTNPSTALTLIEAFDALGMNASTTSIEAIISAGKRNISM